MTDDNDARYRSNENWDRDPDPAATHNDPLAELARLIGQNDPFADLSRDMRAAAPREPQPADEADAHAIWPEPAMPVGDYESTGYDSGAEHHDPRHAAPQAERNFEPDPDQPPGPRFFTPDPQPGARLSAERYQRESIIPADYRAPPFGRDLNMGLAPPAPPPPVPDADALYEVSSPPPRRTGWAATALSVVALIGIGVGSALAYRTFFGNGIPEFSVPPIIRASAEPTKVAPPPPKNDTTTAKINFDRFGDRSQNEKVVVREEKPVDPKTIVTAPPPPVAPAISVAPPSGPAPAAQAMANFPNPPSVLTEPKRVRTVTVRPDQPDPAVKPLATTSPPPARRQAMALTPPAANAPLDVTPQASARLPARGVAAPLPAARTANAPLSLAPTVGLPPPRPAAIATAPARIAAAPARTAAAPAASQNGRYLVQVSSQRSEGDAQNAFRNIQSRYSSVLGGHQSVIRRADLGSKGVYYRAMVGPFSTRDQAVQLCVSLKAAGGDCVVQSN